MFSNTIEFSTDEKYIKNYPFCNPQPTKLNIPEWVKSIAKGWVMGIISDRMFVQNLQYLIDEKIISFPIEGQKGI